MIPFELLLALILVMAGYVVGVKAYRERHRRALEQRQQRALEPDDISTPEWYQTPEQVTGIHELENWWESQASAKEHAAKKLCFDPRCAAHYPPGKYHVAFCGQGGEHTPHLYGSHNKCPGVQEHERYEVRGDDKIIARWDAKHDDCYLCRHPELP